MVMEDESRPTKGKKTKKSEFPENRFFRVVFWIFLLTGKSD